MGTQRLYEYVKKFGFGEKTGVDLPGESAGIMFELEAMGELETATVAFGQGIAVTPIQLVTAFSAIVNGGTLYTPYITKSFNDPISGDVIAQSEPKAKRRVISEETSEKMRYALESVVANGGGRNAYIEGYRIGGKTGTAQKAVDGAYLPDEYILSFLSAARWRIRRSSCMWRSMLRRMMCSMAERSSRRWSRRCMRIYCHISAQKRARSSCPKKLVWPETEAIVIEDFIGRSKDEVQQEGVIFEFFGEGDTVIDQLPRGGVHA